MRLLFSHGWALDRTLWDGVLTVLGQDAAGAMSVAIHRLGGSCGQTAKGR